MIDSLRFVHYRNLKDAQINTRGKDVFLIGENGQGKTNILEAVYICCYASSFRGSGDKEIVAYNERDWVSSVTINDGGATNVLQSVSIKFENNKKTVSIDGKQISDRKQLLSMIPCVVFCHEDMEFVHGNHERRRWFFDQNRCLYDSLYLDDLRNYKKILKTRNLILRECKEGRRFGNTLTQVDEVFGVLESQFIEYGLRLMEKRAEEAAAFSQIFSSLYKIVSGIDHIAVSYRPSWKDTGGGIAELALLLAAKREQDIVMGTSMSGPHRDRYVFTREGKDFSDAASTGQRRLLALLLRVAQASRYRKMAGRDPVLLLDDVLLELDGEKRERFLSVMPAYEQAFYTFLPEEPFEKYKKPDTLVYRVSEGELVVSG
jgi:DNA replication and repair protein RecF